MTPLDYLSLGSIGQFWRYNGTLPREDDTPEFGRIVAVGRAIYLDAVDERADIEAWTAEEATLEPGTTFLGQLPNDAVLSIETWSRGTTRVLGGHHISTQSYAARSLVGGNVPLHALRSASLSTMRALYHSMSFWAGMVASEEEFEFDEGKVSGFTIKLTAPSSVTATIDNRLSLTIEPRWSVGGPEDLRLLSIPIAIGCVSKLPADPYTLLRPLLDIQGLLGMLFGGFVSADRCEAVLDLDPELPESQRRSYPLWNGALMVTPEGVTDRSDDRRPAVRLATLGGIAGLARWIRLCRTHERATEVAISPYRYGFACGEVDLLAIGAALEYWVAAHRNRKWAAKKPSVKGRSAQAGFALAVAGQAGQPFAEWVGDVDRWCTDFSDAYNGLRHNPNFAIADDLLADPVVSGRYLLFAVLLNRVAGTRRPSEAIFNDDRLTNRGQRIRSRLMGGAAEPRPM
jgi:hypothetical protein